MVIFLRFQPIHQEILEKEPVYNALLESGENLKNASEVQEDKDNFNEKLQNLAQRWTYLKSKSAERDAALDEAVEATTEYQELRDKFLPWLDEAEKACGEVQPSCDPVELKEQGEKLKVCCC